MPVRRLAPALALLAALAACGPFPSPPAPPPATADCAAAEERLLELGCVSDGVELGRGFATACRRSAEDGIDWHPGCIAAAPSCEAAERAWVKGCGR